MLRVNLFLKTTLVLLMFILSLTASANFEKDDTWFTSRDLLIKNKTFFEIFGGAVYPNMVYSNKSFDQIERTPYFIYDAGVSLRFQRGKWFSYSPRLTYFGQGISMNDALKYQLRENSVGFSFPFELQFDLSKEMNKSISKLFFYAGPFVSIPVSAHIQTANFTEWLNYNDMKTFDYGGEIGVGVRIPTFSLEGSSIFLFRLSYQRGFNNTFTQYEKSIVDQAKRNQLYVNDGKRFYSALKLTIGIELPLKQKKMVSFTAGGNGKKNYKRVVVVDEK